MDRQQLEFLQSEVVTLEHLLAELPASRDLERAGIVHRLRVANRELTTPRTPDADARDDGLEGDTW